jgi:arylsulfatase
MGYRTPNIDRIARKGMMFTDAYGEQSCTAGRSSFITGQSVYRTGLSKVGIPAAPVGMSDKIVTIAALLKEQGYATGQFVKNHLGDLNKHLPQQLFITAARPGALIWGVGPVFSLPTRP